MNYADELQEKLNAAIAQTVSLRGSYADDFRHFTRNRKLPLEQLITLMLSMTGGTLARELYDAGINMAVSSSAENRKQLGYLAFYRVMDRFNLLCAEADKRIKPRRKDGYSSKPGAKMERRTALIPGLPASTSRQIRIQFL